MAKKSKRVAAVTADISVPLFKIAARFCSTEETRSYISGVRIERHPDGGIVMVGTDGHRMVVIYDKRGRCSRPVTLEAKRGLKLARKADKSTVLEETRWRVATRVRKGWLRLPTIDDPFPDWRRIPAKVATTRGGAIQTFNASYVADFMRIARELGGEDRRVTLVPGKTDSDPLLVLFAAAPHVCAIVMPMLQKNLPTKLPAFMWPVIRNGKRSAK